MTWQRTNGTPSEKDDADARSDASEQNGREEVKEASKLAEADAMALLRQPL